MAIEVASRRTVLGMGLSGLVLLLAGCAPHQRSGESARTASRFSPTGVNAGPGADTVLVLLPPAVGVEETYNALRDELSEEFNVYPVPLDRRATSSDLEAAIERVRPRCIVIFDNRVLEMYREYQNRNANRAFPPAVVVLTSYVKEFLHGLRNVSGIAFEIPVASSVPMVRPLLSTPIERVGVVYREPFAEYLVNQANLARVEEVQLIGASVPETPRLDHVRRALEHLIRVQRVDAMWVLNDNVLLSPEMITRVWRPVLREMPLPTIVGVEALVAPEAPFGTFGVVPDMAAMGVQAANRVYDIAETDWAVQAPKVSQPLSVRTILDIRQARAHFDLREDNLILVSQVKE